MEGEPAISIYLVQMFSPRLSGPSLSCFRVCEVACSCSPLSMGLDPCVAQCSGRWSSSIKTFDISFYRYLHFGEGIWVRKLPRPSVRLGKERGAGRKESIGKAEGMKKNRTRSFSVPGNWPVSGQLQGLLSWPLPSPLYRENVFYLCLIQLHFKIYFPQIHIKV